MMYSISLMNEKNWRNSVTCRLFFLSFSLWFSSSFYHQAKIILPLSATILLSNESIIHNSVLSSPPLIVSKERSPDNIPLQQQVNKPPSSILINHNNRPITIDNSSTSCCRAQLHLSGSASPYSFPQSDASCPNLSQIHHPWSTTVNSLRLYTQTTIQTSSTLWKLHQFSSCFHSSSSLKWFKNKL